MKVHANPTNPLMSRVEGPSPAMQVGLDMIKRGAYIAPAMVALGAAIWGADGAASVAYGLAIVLVNVWLSAAVIAYTSRISFAMVAAGAMFGFLIRLGLVMVAVLLVRNASWVDLVALSITLVVTHLGLLFWELRYISASLAFPGLKPAQTKHKSKYPNSANTVTTRESIES